METERNRLHWPGYDTDPLSFWEEADESFAHIAFEAAELQSLLDDWRENVLPHCEWSGRDVIDYGCGGAWLINVLPSTISSYTGWDISTRAVERAIERCRDLPYETSIRLLNSASPFKGRPGSVILCLNVIHHLPTAAKLKAVLSDLLGSGAADLILTIREMESSTWFRPSNPGNACWTCVADIEAFLEPAYRLVHKTEKGSDVVRRYLHFRREGL